MDITPLHQLMFFLAVLTFSFLALLYIAIKLYRNVKTIDSHSGIVNELDKLTKNLENYNKELKRVKAHIAHVEGKIINSIIGSTDHNHSNAMRYIQSELGKQSMEVNSLSGLKNSLEQMAGEIKGIREYALKQQESVERFKQGYDWKIFKNNVFNILNLIEHISEIPRSEEHQDDELNGIVERLEIYLESLGVEVLEVEENSDYRDNSEFCKPEPIATSEQQLHDKIHAVKKKGYVFVSQNGEKQIIRHAEVIVYQFRDKEATHE